MPYNPCININITKQQSHASTVEIKAVTHECSMSAILRAWSPEGLRGSIKFIACYNCFSLYYNPVLHDENCGVFGYIAIAIVQRITSNKY